MADFLFDPDRFDPEDLERISRDAEQTMRRLTDAERELGEIRGEGTAADGMITVVTDGKGHVEKIALNPRVMRLETHALAEELLRAIRGAQEDGERRASELLGEALGDMRLPREGAFDLGKVEERLTRSHESFAHTMEGLTEDARARRPNHG